LRSSLVESSSELSATRGGWYVVERVMRILPRASIALGLLGL
jgi:hypothetical protein